MNLDPNKLAYQINEAAKAVGVSRATLYRQIGEGKLPTFKFCGRTLIRRDVLERLIDEASGQRAA
jgi:excisionase family DNA binding protein